MGQRLKPIIAPFIIGVALLLIGATQVPLNLGTAPNDGTGDPLRTTFIKIETNLTALFSTIDIGASSVTNAISTVSSNGTAASAAATNLNYISSATVRVLITNRSGFVDVQLLATNTIRTNSSQFLGVPLSLKRGLLMTNATNFAVFTSDTNNSTSYEIGGPESSGATALHSYDDGYGHLIVGGNNQSGFQYVHIPWYLVVTQGVSIVNLSSNSLLSVNGYNNITNVSVGSAILFDGTNLAPVSSFAATSTKQIDANLSRTWIQTNRLSAATTLNLTNISSGNTISLTVSGEASGGTDRGVLLVWPAGWFASYANDLATNGGVSTVTVTNGQTVEFSIACGSLQSTNTARVVFARFSR